MSSFSLVPSTPLKMLRPCSPVLRACNPTDYRTSVAGDLRRPPVFLTGPGSAQLRDKRPQLSRSGGAPPVASAGVVETPRMMSAQ
jgi:hypothetical protein